MRGVGTEVEHHGMSDIGTSKLPYIKSEVALFGLGSVSMDGKVIATGMPVHVMTAEQGLANGAKLELDVGDPDMPAIQGLPDGHLRLLWNEYEGGAPHAPETTRYTVGAVVMVLLLVGALILTRREAAGPMV